MKQNTVVQLNTPGSAPEDPLTELLRNGASTRIQEAVKAADVQSADFKTAQRVTKPAGRAMEPRIPRGKISGSRRLWQFKVCAGLNVSNVAKRLSWGAAAGRLEVHRPVAWANPPGPPGGK